MVGTYIAAGLICAASIMAGRAIFAAIGREGWSFLEPAVGLAAVLTVAGFLARFPGHADTATVGVVALVLASLVALRLPYNLRGAAIGIPVALLILAAASIPFAISGRYGLIGVGFNNDLGLHLAWTEWLRDGLGPSPQAGYPLGPHALAAAISILTGIDPDKAFTGFLLAIAVITGWTGLAVMRELRPARRLLAAALVALPYLAASYFAQAAFKETAEALLVLAFAIALPAALPREASLTQRLLGAVPLAVLAAGIVFSYSFAGLAWPIAALVLYCLTLPELRAALAPRRILALLRRPIAIAAIAVAGGAVLLLAFVGPYGFGEGFRSVQGMNTYGPVSPAEALGFWAAANYRLDAAGGAPLAGLTTAVAIAALLIGLAWWWRRGERAVPAALAGGALIYAGTLAVSGDYARAKALMIIAPLVMLVCARALLAGPLPGGRLPRVAWGGLAAVFLAGAAYSSFLALRDAPVAPPGHGAELAQFLPRVEGRTVLYAGQDRYAAYELRGADTSVPVVEFPDSKVEERPTKPFDTGVAYSPIDFDSFKAGTLNRFDFVVTSSAAYASQAPPNFRPVDRSPSYVLWQRQGETPHDRQTRLEGTAPAASVDCAAPETRIFTSYEGRAAVIPAPLVAEKDAWDHGPILDLGEQTSQELLVPSGRWLLSLQYFSPVDLTLRAPGFSKELPAALDGARPAQLSLANDGQYWPAGSLTRDSSGRLPFTIAVDEPNWLGDLAGYDAKAYLGELVLTRAGAERELPLPATCGRWIDWYVGEVAP
jgi:hypothetical protein